MQKELTKNGNKKIRGLDLEDNEHNVKRRAMQAIQTEMRWHL